uniref:DNA mismatch repair protein MSH4 n=1 Tax=Watanabea reniformis TaxID=191674 RepID=A0A0K0MX21_9CHLO|nr:DNA mismatch repair protein MSH4 [Watanabea reniformis]
MPDGFMQLQNKARKEAHCTTHELHALNLRLQDALNDCMVLTYQVLDGLVTMVLQRMGLLHKLTDNMALLDKLCAFAGVVRDSVTKYVRPKCTEEGPLAIVEGRHPLLECMEGIDFRPNDTYLADYSSFYIISGPNMSGKSTYLRQVALIVIMAQMGCFVPAKFASIRMVDRLFTRIGAGDSIESNSSSFMVEMQETAYIVNNATPRSLVIIDELGRATSTADGVGIAWAVSEHLISLACPTLFATHFARLEELATLYPNCKLWHFNVDVDSNQLHFTWCLRPGAKTAAHYGLKLAPMVRRTPRSLLSCRSQVLGSTPPRTPSHLVNAFTRDPTVELLPSC